MKVPMAPERRIVRQCWNTSRDAREDGVDLDDTALTAGPRMACSTSATPKAPDQRRQQPDAAGQVRDAEGEALVVVVRLLPDGGDP